MVKMIADPLCLLDTFRRNVSEISENFPCAESIKAKLQKQVGNNPKEKPHFCSKSVFSFSPDNSVSISLPLLTALSTTVFLAELAELTILALMLSPNK
jgi:hypothetical protein